MTYYIFDDRLKKLIECSEEEYNQFNENYEYKTWVQRLYCGSHTIDEVPEEIRERVLEMLDEYINTYGYYEDQPITGDEVLVLTEEAI